MTNPNHSAQAGIGVQAPERSKAEVPHPIN